MGINLGSLFYDIEVKNKGQAVSALQEIDAIGKKTASAMRELGNDTRLATSHFLTGRASVSDFTTAIRVAHTDATALGGGFRALATTASGVFRGIGDAAVSGFRAVSAGISGFFAGAFGQIVALIGVVTTLKASFAAADQFTKSSLMLEGAARRASIPIEMLHQQAGQFKEQFTLATPVANEMAAVMARMGQRAGDVNLAAKAMKDFMNVGASVGLSPAETLFRLDEALRGMDEGTDVLFQKNPSQIFKEYAQSIGTTAHNLTSAQQAQALMNEAMVVAARDPGAYQRFLETTLGKQAAFNAALLESESRFGTALAPMRLFALEMGTKLLNALSSLPTSLKTGWTSIGMLFTELLPGYLNLGLGKMAGALASFAGLTAGLFARLGINVGSGLHDTLASYATALANDGNMSLAKWRQWGDVANRRIAAAAGDGPGVDMSPITFPGVPTPGGASGGDSDAALGKQLRHMLAQMPGGTFATAPNDLGSPLGSGGPMGLRGGFGTEIAGLEAPLKGSGKEIDENSPAYMRGATFMDQLRTGLVSGLAKLRPFQEQLAGFFQNVFATGKIGTSLKNFGKEILAGMGSIFAQMAAKAIIAAPLFQAIGAAMHNPFTAGFALLAFGIALSALGASMGGAAQGGSGGDGGIRGRSEDTITQIHLTANGAGGFTAVKPQGGDTYVVFGANDPAVHRQLSETVKNAKRSGYRF